MNEDELLSMPLRDFIDTMDEEKSTKDKLFQLLARFVLLKGENVKKVTMKIVLNLGLENFKKFDGVDEEVYGALVMHLEKKKEQNREKGDLDAADVEDWKIFLTARLKKIGIKVLNEVDEMSFTEGSESMALIQECASDYFKKLKDALVTVGSIKEQELFIYKEMAVFDAIIAEKRYELAKKTEATQDIVERALVIARVEKEIAKFDRQKHHHAQFAPKNPRHSDGSDRIR